MSKTSFIPSPVSGIKHQGTSYSKPRVKEKVIEVTQKVTEEVKARVIQRSALKPPSVVVHRNQSAPQAVAKHSPQHVKPDSSPVKSQLPSVRPGTNRAILSLSKAKPTSHSTGFYEPQHVNGFKTKQTLGSPRKTTPSGEGGTERKIQSPRGVNGLPPKGFSRTLISYKSSEKLVEDPSNKKPLGPQVSVTNGTGEVPPPQTGAEKELAGPKIVKKVPPGDTLIRTQSASSSKKLGLENLDLEGEPQTMGRSKDVQNDPGGSKQLGEKAAKPSKPTSRLLAMKNRLRQAQKKKDEKDGKHTTGDTASDLGAMAAFANEPPLTIRELTSSPTEHQRLGRLPRSHTLDVGIGQVDPPLREGERVVSRLPRSHTINMAMGQDEPKSTSSNSDIYANTRGSPYSHDSGSVKSVSNSDLYGTVRASRPPHSQGQGQAQMMGHGQGQNTGYREMPIDVEMIHPNPRSSRGMGVGSGSSVLKRSQTTQGISHPPLEQIPESEQLQSYGSERQVRSGSTDRLLDERKRLSLEGKGRNILYSIFSATFFFSLIFIKTTKESDIG